MADDQVVTNIVARADFSDLIANVRKVTTSLAAMQQQIGSSNKVLSAQINAVNRSFGETLRSTGQFSTHFVSLANDVDVFGKRLDGGKLKLRDYFSTLQTHTRTSGGLIRDLARQQVQLQNAILQPLGRNAQGLMQFNVHVPQGLDQIKNKGAIARQEMQILNKVMQEGSVGLINWGKNTQWAGRQLTVGLTVPIVAFGAAAAKAFREADQELTRLTKVYGGLSATSSSELQKVRRDVTAVANELARGYGSSFKETLALSADIAATGKQGSELLGSIRETTRLAVLGEVDRQDAMKATLAIQSAFRQDTDELAKSINFLNAVENQTSTSLADLVEAIPKAGPIIKGLGGDIQDLALYLTAMKEGGINASEGANAIKSALASLINPTDVAVKKFEGFGIDLMGIVNNNAGDVTKTLFALQGALNKLDPLQKSQAIEQLFGKFQFARLSALFENLGAQGSQTLKVLDLMKASSKDLESIASRELSMVTESASGKYRRAVEGLKADLAGVGEEFLKVSTFFINLVDGIVQFVNKLPAPVKTILTFLAGLTAVTGPLIMLTGVLANFLGYVIKGAFHLKALFKGGEGWRMLTPEILAANQAGSLIEKTFYSDAKAALALAEALQVLSAGMTSIQSKMTQGVVSVQPMLSTVAGSVIKPPGDDDGPGGGGGIGRVVDPKNPLVGPVGTRASAHMVPRSGMSQEERAAQTIHSFLPAPIPVNQAVGANPQIFAAGDLPSIPGLTTIPGRAGQVSTGVVASEAAKWHTMVGALSMMTKTEVAQMKTQIRTTGTVTSEFTQAFGSLLPQMTSIASSAASQSAMIVAEAKAGTISVQTARQRIIALNIQVEQLMAQATMGTASSLGRTAVLTGVPTLDQPVVDPKTGKSNMRELFKKGKTRSFVDDLARLMGVRTWGAGYSTHTTIPIRRNMGGKVYNPEVHGNVVPGDTSINYDNTPAVLREGGFILNQSSSRVNPDLVKLAKNSKNAGGKIVPAILTPGETYFPPEIAQEIMPTLEKANSGSVIKLLNAGGMLGGRVSSKKLNYGVRISPIDILSKLGRWNPNMARGARRVYETRASGSRASNSPRTFDPGSQFGPETYHSLFRRSSATWGVHGGALRHGERGADEVLGHVITSKFLRQFKGLPEQGSSRVLTGSQFESRFGSMPGGATPSKVYQVLPDNLITITKDFNSALLNGNATGAMWLSSNRQPQHFISLLSHLLNSGVPYKVAYRVAGKTLERINKAMYRLKDTSLTETKWGNIVDSSMQAEISALSRSYTKGSMHSLNAGGIVPGGIVSRNRFGYGIPALSAAVIARLTSKWKKPAPYAPPTQKHDWTNTDPLHGPLFIGRADIGSDGVRRSLSYNIPSGRIVQGREGKQLVGISPMMSNDPRYLIERYMAGDKSVLARMQYEGRNGLNSHPLSIQSLFKSVSRRFRGTLYRGMTPQSVADTFPKHIVEAIEKARATGDFSQLIGRAFIMRRASFTADPRLAQFFAPGSGGLVLQASLSGRRVTPTSEMFPDKKFQAPYGQDWSRGVSSRRYRSEQESLVGGRFIITGFDGKKLIVEGRAMGGPVSGATPYVVGERGPELFVPKNSGGIIPNYALGGVVKGGKINYGVVPSGNPVADLITQSLSMPTLDSQMRAGSVDLSAYGLGSGELAPLQTPQSPQMSKGPRGMGIAGMLGGLGGMSLGSMLGSKLTGGNQFGSILGGMLGYGAGDAALKALTAKMQGFGNAAGVAAGKTSLLTKTFKAFIGLPGPLKLLAVVVGVGVAVKALNDKIEEHRRIVSSGFGITEESAKKLGLQYKKLGSEIDTYQQKYDLMLAKAAANRFNQTKAEGKGIDITVPELEKLKKEVAKDFPDEIKMFDKATNEEATQRAISLKAGMVAAGKSVEEANEIILAMIMNSNKSAYALEILGDRGFGKIQGKISATNATIKTFSNIIKEGNFDQLPIALQTSVNALDNLQQSFIKIDINAKKAITSSEAYQKVLDQISTTANKPIGEKGLEEILAQNEGLRDVITSTDTLAGIWAKIKLSTSGITFNLKDMSTETATAISLLLEQQKDYLSSNDSLIRSAADLIAKTGNTTANQLIKNANRTKESIQKEIDLRQKNIQRIKDEADAKKKALEEETEAEDFLLQIQKKQIEYSEALASGNMAAAAQAQLDIQSMTGARQLDLAKTAIDTKADKDIKKQQDLIEGLTSALDGLSKSLEKQLAAASSQQAKKADMQGLYDLFFQAVTLGMGGVTADEKLIIGDIARQLTNSGIKEFVDLSSKYLQMSPTGPYVGKAQEMGFGALESLGASSFSVIAGKLQVEDTELSKYIKALANGQTGDSTTNFTPKLTTERSAMGIKSTYTITPQQYVDSGMYVQGQDPVAMKKTFIDYAGRRFKIVGIQEDGDYIVERQFAAGGMIKNFMPGGKVKGPGTETSDSIPAYLSDGEYVIRAASVKKYGVEAMDALNAGKFANGGPVNTSALITPSIPYYMNDGGSISNQLPYFPWRHDLPNYLNGKPTGNPRTGRWGDLRYNPSTGKDIWGGTEIPGLKFTGNSPQQSDYWHQMQEQPNKPMGSGMGVDKDPMRYAGSGASMGGTGSGAYGLGALMLGRGGLAIKPAITWIVNALSKIKLPKLEDLPKFGNYGGFESRFLNPFKQASPTDGIKLNSKSAMRDLISQIQPPGSTVIDRLTGLRVPQQPYTINKEFNFPEGAAAYYTNKDQILHSRFDGMSGGTLAHEYSHHVDLVEAHLSAKTFFDSIKNDVSPEDLLEMKNIYNAKNAESPGHGADALELFLQKSFISQGKYPKLAGKYRAIQEGTAVDQVSILYKRLMAGGKKNLATQIGDPYAGERMGYIGSFYEMARLLDKNPEWKSPGYPEGMIAAGKAMPQKFKDKYALYAKLMKEAGINPTTPSDDPKWAALKKFALRSGFANGGMVKNFAKGGYANPSSLISSSFPHYMNMGGEIPKFGMGGLNVKSARIPGVKPLITNVVSWFSKLLNPKPKVPLTVRASIPGPKSLSEDTLMSIKNEQEELARTIKEIEEVRDGSYFESRSWANISDQKEILKNLEIVKARSIEHIARARETDIPTGLFTDLDNYIQRPLSGQRGGFDSIATATSRVSAYSTIPFFRALSDADMGVIAGWGTKPSPNLTMGLPWIKENGMSPVTEFSWAQHFASRWRPGVEDEIPLGATRHPDVPSHIPDSQLFRGLPSRSSHESWQFLEKDPGLKIGESWNPDKAKSITSHLDWAKQIAAMGGTGGGNMQAIARFEFTPEAKGILDLRGIAASAGSHLHEGADEGLIAPWTKYILKAINKNKYHYTVPRDGQDPTITKLIDEYVFTVLGQTPPVGWKPLYKRANGGYIGIPKFNMGGIIKGPGTETSDSIPAMLSSGEYVIKADSVNKYGIGTFDALNAQRLHKGGLAEAGHQHYNPALASSNTTRPYGPYVPSFKRSNVAKTWDFAKEMFKEIGRSAEWTGRALSESILGPAQTLQYGTGMASPASRYWSPDSLTYMDSEASKAAAEVLNKWTPTPFLSKDNQETFNYIADLRAAGMDSEANQAYAIKTGMSAVNTGSLFLGGALGSATLRGVVGAYGINKFGVVGLETLLPTGSIRYGTKVATGAAANLGTAAAIGLGKPFTQSKGSYLTGPQIKIVATSAVRKQSEIMEDWIEHQGRKIPVFSGGPFGEKRIVYQGAGDDFSELLEFGRVDRVIPTNARGILEYLVSQKPGDKKLAAMLANFQPGKRPGKEEAEFLKKMLAVSSFAPKTFGEDTAIVSQFPQVYLNKIKDDNLEMYGATHFGAEFWQMPKETQAALKALKLELDENYAKMRESSLANVDHWPRVRKETSDIGLVSTPRPEGFTTLISSMLGDKTATAQVTARLKMLTPYLNLAKESYEKNFAERKAAHYLGRDYDSVDTSQIPMIRSAKFGYNKDEFGNIIEENPGYNIYDHLFGPSGNTDMAAARARVSQHWTMYDVVRAGQQHGNSSWSDTEPLIISPLKNLLRTSDFESYSTYDAWRTASFLQPHKIAQGGYSEVQGYSTKKQYVEELMKLGLYKDGDPLQLMYTDPVTKRVLYRIKQKYTSSDLDEIVRLVNEDDRLPNIRISKSSERDINDHKTGENVFVDSGRPTAMRYPSDTYSVARIQRMLAIRQGEMQVGIDAPYWQMQRGANDNGMATTLINRLALMTGTDIGGLHQGSALEVLERSSVEQNPFVALIQGRGTKSTDAAMSALLMHTYFGKFASVAYDAGAKLSPEERQSRLIGEWYRAVFAYKRGETKIKPMPWADFAKILKKIQKESDDWYEQDAEGGYISPENHIKRLKKQGLNIPKFNEGGMAATYNVPKFEKGINMVPANMLAMLHKNEAVVPANMNPFNPNAQSYSQPSISYNISPVINAAPGMDEQAIANMATRQVLAEIKVIDARNNASMGRPGTRVVGK